MKALLQKITFLITFSLLSISTASAQALVYDNIQNLNMLVANIFGVQCEGVSNVQLTGNPVGVAHFENAQILGLNSGIAMFTGAVINGVNGPTNVGFFSSTQIGGPTDPDIDAYELLNGSTNPSFDALAIEFDFTPLVTDTIRFTYVFASEEYPEYVNSGYNDRFLFLVSENGGANTNIALIPGTNTIVEVNTVNQGLNGQYFVDNLNGPNAANFIFDGYTTPFEAKFFAQLGSNYHIKLVIADIADGIFDSGIFLNEQESYNDISGALTVNGTPAEGILEVFNFVQDTLVATPVQTIAVTNGMYNADSLNTGIYHVRFTPDATLFPNVAPLYFTSGTTWSTAQAIALPCYLDEADVNADTLYGFDGNSYVAGTISIDTSFMKSPIVPFEGATVKLINKLNQKVSAFAYSDSEGKYILENVNPGNYYVLVDVPYVPQSDTHKIQINTNNGGFEDVNYDILPTGIVAKGNPYSTAAVNSLENIVFNLYPNPANEGFQLILNKASNEVAEIYSIDGVLIHSQNLSGFKTSISTKELADGMYLIRVGVSGTKQFVVKH